MVSILDGSEQLKNSDVKRCKASFWPMWLTWRTKEGSWTAFEHENKKPLVALILYDDAFKCFQCIWVLEWSPFITLLWHPFLSGSHFPLCFTSKHLRESGLRTFDSISFCCFFFFTHQKNKKNKNGWGMLEFIRHTELINMMNINHEPGWKGNCVKTGKFTEPWSKTPKFVGVVFEDVS